MLTNSSTKLLLETLSNRLESILKNDVDSAEYMITRDLLRTITTTLEDDSLIKEIDVSEVEQSDYISSSHFNELYKGAEDRLKTALDIVGKLSDELNEQLIQLLNTTNSVAKLNEITNTKVEEVSDQVAAKSKLISINDEQIIKIDFNKYPTSQDFDAVNNVLMLKKESSKRWDGEDEIVIALNNTDFDYNTLTGVVDGHIIDNYLVKKITHNEKSSLLDNTLTTKYQVQGIDERPELNISIDTSADGFLFNLVSVFTNDTTSMLVGGENVIGSRNVYVFEPTTNATVNIKNNRNNVDVYVPQIQLIDKTTHESVKDLTYFQSMKILDNDTFDEIISNEEKTLDDSPELQELIGRTTQQVKEQHLKIYESTISDILIESNTYKSTGVWESSKIETGKNIIAVEVLSDYIKPTGADITFSVQIGEKPEWIEIDPLPINVEKPGNIFVANRIVLDASAVSENDGDMQVSGIQEKNYLKLRVNLSSSNPAITPIIYSTKIRIKVEK